MTNLARIKALTQQLRAAKFLLIPPSDNTLGIETYLGKMLFQYLIIVCDNAEKNCPTAWPGIQVRMPWSFEDSAKFEGTEEEKRAKFPEVRDLIEKKIKEWVKEQNVLVR